MYISFHFVLVLFFLFYFVSLFLCVHVCINFLLEVISSQSVINARECAKKTTTSTMKNEQMICCMCVCVWKKNKKLTNKQKNRATCFVFLISPYRHRSSSLTYVQRDTKKKKRKKAAGCLARPTDEKKEMKKKRRNEDRPNGDNNNNGNQQKRKRERERRSCSQTHTHTHTHTLISINIIKMALETKWEKRGKETDKEVTAHKRETWWLNNEQKIHTNSLVQARRSRETRRKRWGKARKNKQTNNWLFHH